MSELPPIDPSAPEPAAQADASGRKRDLGSLLLATYFVALIVVVVALLVVPVVL
jgi:hypothetical protein